MKVGKICLLFVALVSLSAKGTIKFEKEIVLKKSTTTYGSLVFSEKEGTSETEIIKVYVPVKKSNSSGIDNHKFLDLPTIDSTGDTSFTFSVSHDDGANRGVYVGLKKGESNYAVIKEVPDVAQNTVVALNFSIDELCRTGDCGLSQDPSLELKQNIVIYIFHHTGFSENINPSEEGLNNGLYFELKFNTGFDDVNSPGIVSLDQGDTQLFLTYTSSDSFGSLPSDYITDIEKVYVYQANSVIDSVAEKLNYRQVIDSKLKIREFEASSAATIAIDNLPNGENQNLAVAFVNKYQFVSRSSFTASGAPQSIETFIDEQNCFLISAAFQTNHYVLDEFRSFRDEVLQRSALGSSFVNWYYENARDYAHYVYENRALAFIVRCAAYMVYFFLVFPLSVVLMILGLVLVFFLVKRYKLHIKEVYNG